MKADTLLDKEKDVLGRLYSYEPLNFDWPGAAWFGVFTKSLPEFNGALCAG
jgi:hypothetical protein